jgi:hypothetical protein
MFVGTVQNLLELPECLGCFDLVGIVCLPAECVSMGKAVADLTRKVWHKVACYVQKSFSSSSLLLICTHSFGAVLFLDNQNNAGVPNYITNVTQQVFLAGRAFATCTNLYRSLNPDQHTGVRPMKSGCKHFFSRNADYLSSQHNCILSIQYVQILRII